MLRKRAVSRLVVSYVFATISASSGAVAVFLYGHFICTDDVVGIGVALGAIPRPGSHPVVVLLDGCVLIGRSLRSVKGN